MAYQFGNGIWANVFAVPCDIVDKHIRLCSPLSLKVLMVLLRSGGALELGELSETLGQSRADVQDALNYWTANGVISPAGEAVEETPALTYALVPDKEPEPTPPLPAPPEPKGRRIELLTAARSRLTMQEINDMADVDASIGGLLQEAQHIMGKPLTPVLTDMVVALYSYYGMEPDIVLMLMQYCVSMGKESVRYMEKVAASWVEQGIDSHEKAEEEILKASRKNQVEHEIKSAFGIYDRTLVPKEKRFIATWVEEFHMELPLIQLAFERCVELKGKLSFDYINGILSNWNRDGIKTPARAMQEMQQKKDQRDQRKPASVDGAAASYDMNQLEHMIANGDLST